MKRMIDIHDVLQFFEVAQKDAFEATQTANNEKDYNYFAGIHSGIGQARLLLLRLAFQDENVTRLAAKHSD